MSSEAPANAAAGASFAGAAAAAGAGSPAPACCEPILSFICLRYCMVGSTEGGSASRSATTDANTDEAGLLTRRSPDGRL